MTLALGLKYPWGKLTKLTRTADIDSEAIILASDSRWTRFGLSSEEAPVYEDVGTKLFQLGNDVGAVYAGISDIGERCLTLLAEKLQTVSASSSENSVSLAERMFRHVWADFLESESSNLIPREYFVLDILLGTCNRDGIAEFYQFSQKNDFRARALTNPSAIGIRKQAEILLKKLELEIETRVNQEIIMKNKHADALAALNKLGSPIPVTFIKTEDIAFIIGHYLNEIICSQVDKAIGGKIQCAIISKEGFREFVMSNTSDPTNEGPGWTQATVLTKNLETLNKTFSCFSITDFNPDI